MGESCTNTERPGTITGLQSEWVHVGTIERNRTQTLYVLPRFFLAQVLVYLLMAAWLMGPDWCVQHVRLLKDAGTKHW